jgi:hypothetical protein
MLKKYELTKETISIEGHTIHRIRALRDFGDVKAGDLGGYVESEENLSHDGNCWIYDDAKVFGHAKVLDNALIYNITEVSDNAEVSDHARVFGDSIFGNAKVCGFATLFDDVIFENVVH